MPDHQQASLSSPSILTSTSTDATLTSSATTATTTTTTDFTFPPIHAFPPFYTLQPNAATLDAQLRDWSALIRAYCRHHRLFRLALSDQPHQQQQAAAASTAAAAGWSAAAGPAAGAAAAADPAEQLFHNRALGRRLRPADARRVLEYMRDREGTAEPAAAGAGFSSSFTPSTSGAATSGSAAAGDGTAAGGGGTTGAGAGGGVLAGLAGLAGGEGKKGAAAAAVAANVWWIWWRKADEWAAMLETWIEETGQKNMVLTLYELTQGDLTLGTEFHEMDPEVLQKALAVLVKRGKAQVFSGSDTSLQGVKFF